MYLETSTVVWACEKQQQNGIVWRRKMQLLYIYFWDNNLYLWSVLHRELLENISKYRLKDIYDNKFIEYKTSIQ